MDIDKYVDPDYKGPTILRGYLKKLKHEMAIVKFLKKFTKRYFIIDLNNYFFGYQQSENSSKIQKFSLGEIRKVEGNPKVTHTCSYKFAFYLEIGNRDLFLYANSLSAHKEWCAILSACLKPDPHSLPSTSCEQNSIPISYDLVKDNSKHKIESKADFVIQQENPQPEDSYIPKPKINENSGKLITKTPEPLFEKEKDLPKRPDIIVVKQDTEVSKQTASDKKLNFISVPKINDKRLEDCISVAPSVIMKKQINTGDDASNDEVIVISGPKKIDKKEDDYVSILPVFFSKDKIIPKKEVRLAPEPCLKNPVHKEKQTPNTLPSSTVRASFNTKSGGIADMLSDLDSIGVSNIEVRSGSELRENISQKAYKSDTFNHDEPAKPDKVSNVDKRGFFRPEENSAKPSFKAVTCRTVNTKINSKPKFEEKPLIVQDDFVEVKMKPKPNPVPISHREVKQKPVYKEVNAVKKENDCDWDEWDD